MSLLRETVSELMVRIHLIPPELADDHVRRMTPADVRRRFLMYHRLGLTKPGPQCTLKPIERDRFAERIGPKY